MIVSKGRENYRALTNKQNFSNKKVVETSGIGHDIPYFPELSR